MKSRPENFYTVTETIAILKLGYTSLLRSIKRGDIKAAKIGNGWRIPESELKRLTE